MKKDKNRKKYRILSLISFLSIIVLWCVITYGGFVKELFVPSPTAVIKQVISGIKDGSLLADCLASTRRVMVGWLFSSVAALPCGMVMARSLKFTAIIQPVIEFVRYLPVVALVPLTILYLGIGETQKYMIDLVAGLSEIFVIADETCNASVVAADLLSQAEHDVLSTAVLATTSRELAENVAQEIEKQLALLPREKIARSSIEKNGLILIADSIDEAVEMANELAPEHLELCVDNPFDYVSRIKNAGCAFQGQRLCCALCPSGGA